MTKSFTRRKEWVCNDYIIHKKKGVSLYWLYYSPKERSEFVLTVLFTRRKEWVCNDYVIDKEWVCNDCVIHKKKECVCNDYVIHKEKRVSL